MSNEQVEKLKTALAIYLVYHEKAVNHDILHTMQIPSNYISEKYPDEIAEYKKLLDEEYGIGAADFVHCKECVHRYTSGCISYPMHFGDDFYCARGEEK